jgi:hypothetical protein
MFLASSLMFVKMTHIIVVVVYMHFLCSYLSVLCLRFYHICCFNAPCIVTISFFFASSVILEVLTLFKIISGRYFMLVRVAWIFGYYNVCLCGHTIYLKCQFVFFLIYFESQEINDVTVFFLDTELYVDFWFTKFCYCFVYVGLLWKLIKKNLRTWALLEGPPVVETLNSFPESYGTQRFITAFTRALHIYLFWARSTKSTPHHIVSTRSISILSTSLRIEAYRLLGCDAVWLLYEPKFRRNVGIDKSPMA